MNYQGGCHCRAIRFAFESDVPLSPRACQCSFCRKHGSRNVTDPSGSASLVLGAATLRYRFGTKTTDFLICGRCGVYVGALTDLDGKTYVSLNLNAFDDPHLDLSPTPVWYDGEDPSAKADRRRARWTYARLA